VPKRVLVVDDHPPTVALIRDALEGAGLSVSSARNGAECLIAIAQQRPDLVVLDIMMPIMDGMHTLRVLRERPETADLPVIILSGRGGFRSVKSGLDNGANMFLEKPVRVATVIAAARWMLGIGGKPGATSTAASAHPGRVQTAPST
jgi:DNA-binding response OmpR family regulator